MARRQRGRWLARTAATSFLTAPQFSGIIHHVLGAHHERSLSIAGQALPLPCFFPSVSSVKANQRPAEYVDLLVALREPQLLISAYDLQKAAPADRKRMARSLGRATKQGAANQASLLAEHGHLADGLVKAKEALAFAEKHGLSGLAGQIVGLVGQIQSKC
jgi:hypothetical protein